ncbi:MAG: TolC family protein [Bacteroidetes bacterium]|nr:TolC family protein [Bacteroidota bacterium]
MKNFSIFLAFLFFYVYSKAQSEWSLKRCIEHALQNNISIKKGKLNNIQNRINLEQSKEALYPSLSANVTQSYNWGRNINPVNNTYIEQAVRSNQFGVGTYITLFNGLQNINTVKQNQINIEAGSKELEVIENNISLQVATQFLQILLFAESVKIAQNTIESTKKQLETSRIQYDAGNLAKNFVMELEAKLSSDNLELVNSQNNYNLALITLANLLQIENPENFRIEKPEVKIPDEIIEESIESIYQKASTTRPEIELSKLRYKSSQIQKQIAKGGYYPTLSLNANLGTLVSNNFKEYYNPQTQYIPFGIVQNTNETVLIPNVTYETRKRNFSKQLNDNLGKSIMLNLSIPIYSNGRNKNTVKQAEILSENSKLDLQQMQNELYSSISVSMANYKASLAKYKALEDAFVSQKNNNDFNKQRYESGTISSSDFILSQKNYDAALSRLAQGKYELVFRKILLDFYRGKQLEIN